MLDGLPLGGRVGGTFGLSATSSPGFKSSYGRTRKAMAMRSSWSRRGAPAPLSQRLMFSSETPLSRSKALALLRESGYLALSAWFRLSTKIARRLPDQRPRLAALSPMEKESET